MFASAQPLIVSNQFSSFAFLAIAAGLFAGLQMARGSGGKIIAGNVHSGSSETAIPLSGAVVKLYHATREAPQLLGTTTSDTAGNFSVKAKGAGSGGIW